MMDTIPRYNDERCRLDSFCKSVLRNEAVDYLRSMQRQREREKSFSDLTQAELSQLCTEDRHSCDEFVFSSHGCDLHIDNERVANAFAELSQEEQSVLILHFVMELTDKEAGVLLGLSQYAVRRRRKKALDTMRNRLRPILPKGG